MAEKTPVRVNFDNSNNAVGFAEYQSADFIGLDDGGTGGSYASLAALLEGIGLGTSDSPTFTGLTTSGNVTIGGNLTVDGSTTTVNSTITTLDDPIITLGGDTPPASDDNKDRGVEFRYHTGSGAKVGFFGFDDSSGKFTFIPDATNTAEVFSGSVGTIVANLEGNVTGTVSSLSGLDTDNLSEGSSNLYFTNERVDDRVGALLIDSATSGIDINYDDANNQLTISADLSEITTDLNERVDDRVDSLLTAGSNVSLTYDDAAGTLTIASTDTNTQLTTEEVQDIVGGMVDGGTETNVAVTYDDTAGKLNFVVSQLTSEQVQDIIGPMFSSNTETFITVTYDDSDGTLDLVVPVLDEDNMASDSASHLATQQSIKAYVDSQVQTEESIEDFIAGSITAGSNVSVTYDDAAGTITIASTDTNTQLTQEQVEDFVGGMVSSNTETLIAVTYDDTNGKLNFVVDNDLANYDNSTSGFITATLTQEQVEDFVGGMLDGTETLITVSYDDTDGNIDFVVDNDLANYSNTNSAFITLASLSGGTGVTYNNGTGAISIGQAVGTSDNVTFNNLVLDGNLTVNGTTTAVESTTVTINDPMVRYADNNTGNSVDFGFYGKYVQSSTTKFGGLVWDASQSDKFRLFHGLQTEPTTTVDISATGHTVGTLIANLEGNVTGNVTGNVSGSSGSTTGNAATATALASAQNFSLTGDVTASAVSFDGSGAVALATTIASGAVDFAMIADTIDEDNMASDSATKIPTQQSVKAYVDSQLTAQDLDFQADSGGALSIDLDSETLTISGTSNEIETSGSGNTVTVGLPSATEITTSLGVGGGSTNGVVIEQGGIKIKNGGTQSYIDFYCESNNAHYARIQAPAHADFSGNHTITLPNTAGTLQLAEAAIDLNGNNLVFDTDGDTKIVASADDVLQLSFAGNTSTPTEFGAGYISLKNQGSESYIRFYCEVNNAHYVQLQAPAHSNFSGNPTVTLPSSTQTLVGRTSSDTLTNKSISGSTNTLTNIPNSALTNTGITVSDGSNSTARALGSTITFSGTSNEVEVAESSGTITVGLPNDVTIGNNLTVTGNLDVNGTTTTIDTTNTTVTDSIIELANGTSGSPSNDAGIIIERGSADNAFIGFDESADKFIVGTGSFTGADTGNLTISTGTLVANLEGEASGIGATAVTGLTAETSQDNSDLVIIYDDSASALRKMTVGNLLQNAGAFNSWTLQGDAGSNQTVNDGNTVDIAGGTGITTTAGATDTLTVAVDDTIITGQGTYSGTVDTTNDFVLVYDHSATALKKIAVSDLNSASGAGTMSNFTIAADSGSNQVVADANTLTLTGGSGIDTSVGGTDEVTIALNTEAVQDIVGAMFSSNTETNITATYQDSDGTIDLVAGGGTVTEAFKTISVSGQSDVVADGATDTLTFAAGANITLTTDASSDEITIAATGGAANAFSTFAVSGQSNVVADSTTDTMTFVAGTGMTLTTDASADSITFTSDAAGGGTMPFTAFDGSTDNIILSSATTGGALPVTLAGGTSDPINMTATTQTLTSYADDDGDTKVEVERSSDNDTVHVKAGGTDVITATSSGVTITNLTVTGTTTQANELKITDTLFELNADGGSLTTDAGLIIERGSTGDNAAFIWDESTDSFVAATTATDGSASSNLTYTEATLKAATQSQSDNSTKVATTAYVDTAVGNLSSNSIADADNDTKIQVEESSDEDIIRADTGGQERLTIDNNVSMSSRGGFFTHNLTMHSSETFTIASTEGTVAAGPLDVQGTVDVQGSLVIL